MILFKQNFFLGQKKFNAKMLKKALKFFLALISLTTGATRAAIPMKSNALIL
jgi:hypothetical protein